jgi:transketolase
VNELATFRKLDSRLQGHPATHEGLPGVRIASGSLGQGLSVACGVAEAKKLDRDNHNVFCLMGDGELQEGQIWEAVMYAAHNKLDNLIGIVDWNGRQIDGDNDDVLTLGDLKGKWETFGWDCVEVDGNNMQDLVQVLEQAKANSGNGKPQVILMRTEMGYPIDFMIGSHKWHGVAPNAEQTETALAQLEETMGDYPYPFQ